MDAVGLYVEQEEDTQKDKYLTFRLGEEEYGISIKHVIEIVGILKITTVPEMPEYIKGMINLRGKVIPVMDVRLRFGLVPREYDERTCVIVTEIQSMLVGLIVDTVSEVARIPEADVEPASSLGGRSSTSFIAGIGKSGEGIKILLDVNQLIFENDAKQLSNSKQG